MSEYTTMSDREIESYTLAPKGLAYLTGLKLFEGEWQAANKGEECHEKVMRLCRSWFMAGYMARYKEVAADVEAEAVS